MKILVGFKSVTGALNGSGTLELEVPETVTAGHVERLIRDRHELITDWWIVEAPPFIKARFETQAMIDRDRTLRRWNLAVRAALPRVRDELMAECAAKGGNHGARARKNLDYAAEVIEQAIDKGFAFGVGSRKNGDTQNGVSFKTWARIHAAVPAADRLPIGFI